MPKKEYPAMPIRIIASDLDETLLNSDKHITDYTRRVLAEAADRGIFFVPASGRFYNAFPEEVKSLPFLRYAIAANGAEVRDVTTDEILCRAEIAPELSLRIMDYLESLPVLCECYLDGQGWISAEMQARAEEFAPNMHYLQMMQQRCRPVPSLKGLLAETGKPAQKLMFFFKNPADRPAWMAELSHRFPEVTVSSSVANNVELNAHNAGKGNALLALADCLHIPHAATMALGDELNDLSMLECAGFSVAMGNAVDALKAVADAITEDCNHDGEAHAVEHYCLGRA